MGERERKGGTSGERLIRSAFSRIKHPSNLNSPLRTAPPRQTNTSTQQNYTTACAATAMTDG